MNLEIIITGIIACDFELCYIAVRRAYEQTNKVTQGKKIEGVNRGRQLLSLSWG